MAGISAVAIALSGCASATIEDAVPTASTLQGQPPAQTAGQDAAAPVTSAEAASSGGPKDTGSYPNLNVKPQAANQQITPQQSTSEIQALQAAQTGQAATGAGGETSDPEMLRKLATTHADDTLKAIEGQ